MRIGVDEAGKGPVLGSMFAAAVRADPATLPDGVADSKTLAPERRETLAAAIEDVAAIGIAEVPVERIDAPETNMTALTVEAHAEALEQVQTDGAPVLVDAGEVDADRFGGRVTARLDGSIELSARHGADEDDPLVGAASIIAKVHRDSHVDTLAERYGSVGSGYPSDPTTRAFLADYVENHGVLPACARSSWATATDVLAAAEQSDFGDFRSVRRQSD